MGLEYGMVVPLWHGVAVLTHWFDMAGKLEGNVFVAILWVLCLECVWVMDICPRG